MTDPIAVHVAELDRGLHGPYRLRRDLVREVREGLEDAAEAYRGAGVDQRRAGELAVHDFGPTAAIAEQLQGELAAAQARHTALLLAFSFPALLIGWDVAWSGGVEWGHAAPAVIRTLAAVQDLASTAIALGAVGLLLLGLRRSAAPRRVAVATGATALGAVTVTSVLSVAMNVVQADDLWVLIGSNMLFGVVSVASLVALLAMGTLGACTVRTARRSTGVDR
jgi:hypothetical protein